MQFSSTWSIDRTLSGATTPNQSSNGNEGVLRIPQNSSITRKSPLRRSYPSADMQSVFTAAPANLATFSISRVQCILILGMLRMLRMLRNVLFWECFLIMKSNIIL